MSEADVKLFRSWADRMPVAEDPLEFMYENMWAEDVEHRAIEGAPDDHGPIIGRDAMRAYLADWYEMFANFALAIEEVTDAGPGRVITVWCLTGRRAGAECRPTCASRCCSRYATARSCEAAST